MIKIFYFLPFFLLPSWLIGQENHYPDIEVWGIEDSARAHFFQLHQEQDLPICAASLKILGYPHGNRILLEDGRQILTLRGYPELPWEDTITPKRTFPVTAIWEELLALDVFSIESQLTHLYYPAFLQQDTSAFNQLLKEHQQQFQLYGFDSDVQVMIEYCTTLSRLSKEMTLEEVMEILIFADSASNKLKLAASFLLPALIQTDEEAMALLPLLFDDDANRIQHALRYHFLTPGKEADWSTVLPILAIVLEHPDPLVVMDVIEILNHTELSPGLVPELLSRGATTLQEILMSDFTDEWKKEIIDYLETNDIIDQGTTAGECSSILNNYRQ